MTDELQKPLQEAPEQVNPTTAQHAPATEIPNVESLTLSDKPPSPAPAPAHGAASASAPVNNEAIILSEDEPTTQIISTEETKHEKPTQASTGPEWPKLEEGHPILKLQTLLPELLEEAKYNEVYGITLGKDDFYTKLILQKFLRANANDLTKAKDQLLGTLKWRREFNPQSTKNEVFSKKRFGGLGYVTMLTDVPDSPNKKDICTFNIYGAVKNNKTTFEDVEGFLRWRVGLMELGIDKLNLATATTPIPDYGKGPDPYQGIQVHDYLSVSFLRQDPVVKNATKKTIEVMQKYYPETLSRKFFVNVPVIMGWMFTAMKLVLSKETVRKFTVLSYGKDLAGELGSSVPQVYGGTAGSLETAGETLSEKDDGPAGGKETAATSHALAKETA